MKKVDNSANFAAGRMQVGDQLCDGLQSNKSCDTSLHVRALPRSCINCLKYMEVTFRIALTVNGSAFEVTFIMTQQPLDLNPYTQRSSYCLTNENDA
jgi:hypothetical protein